VVAGGNHQGPKDPIFERMSRELRRFRGFLRSVVQTLYQIREILLVLIIILELTGTIRHLVS
jgi:hypothetical protein